MRDVILFAHVGTGILIAVLFALIYFKLRNPSNKTIKSIVKLGLVGTIIAWIHLVISGYYYITFYPPLKSLILAGSWPWAHKILTETKEHWIFLLVPFTTLIYLTLWSKGNQIVRDSKLRKMLMMQSAFVTFLTILMGVMGRLITMGGLA